MVLPSLSQAVFDLTVESLIHAGLPGLISLCNLCLMCKTICGKTHDDFMKEGFTTRTIDFGCRSIERFVAITSYKIGGMYGAQFRSV